MNAQDRKQLEQIKQSLEINQTLLEELSGDLEERTRNVEEHFEGTEKVETMREQTDLVAGLASSLVDLIAEFEELN